MNTKLTLSIEKSVIDKAKQYAADNHRSLSDLIENYLKVLTTEEVREEIELTPTVKTLLGTFKEPENFNYHKALTKVLSEKYLNK